MDENKRKRIRLADNSDMVWKQRREAQKNVHSNIVKDDGLLFRTAKAAKQAEDRLYAEKAEKNRQSKETDIIEKQRREDVRRIEEKIEVRNKILRQEKKLGMEGLLSKEDIRRAQNSNSMVGRDDPLNIKKKDVRGLEGAAKRKKRSKHKLLPSERRDRLSRAKIERGRKKELEKTAKKELYVTDAYGNKISIEKLRKLRGLNKNQAVTRRDTDFAKKYQKSQRREQNNSRIAEMRLRKRDERVH
ncbi:MAG: hypothetical protein IJ752_01275 [Alphaproteobacteria bacterium]|nr:hypothetical protein [Alphaproteobacteria bacterium]